MVNPLVWWRRVRKRQPRSESISVILWSKPGCCLCERAKEILDRLAKEFLLDIEERDITADPVAFARYCYTIPVVEIVGGPIFEGKITEFWLRKAFVSYSHSRPPLSC